MRTYRVSDYLADNSMSGAGIVFPVGKIFNEFAEWSTEFEIALQEPITGMIYLFNNARIKHYFEEIAERTK